MADFYVKYGGKDKIFSLLGQFDLCKTSIKLYSVGFLVCDHYVITKNRKIVIDLKNQDSPDLVLKKFHDLIDFEFSDMFNS